ncbi:NAD-dependent epimerase/dehydratase family protein [Leucobacter japonicus]|uniref:NAD-dependent epimerase/dehydratase family protein n=1 Tax=Leucobacter japonicus TaxID=1461259 RepID=UPI0006A7E821|nr:NAD-dependent epimerase/dehydratase family protein [Leucobacter japonicus]
MPESQYAASGPETAESSLRIAVVGATGNTGTALLRALANSPEVRSVVGIARRTPDVSAEPYSACEWASIDIGAASEESAAIDELTRVFAGIDTVVHLAWLIQPIGERELLRRVNVEGTRRVLHVAAAAGVAHVVVASSVGVYAADPSTVPRSEDWQRGGIETSQYSIDKVAQEELLDAFVTEHPDVILSRVRPALVFQRDAASSIQRYFLSPAVPVQALRHARLPAVPLPAGLRGIQAVHADDLADAYARIVVQRAAGAFNVCADDVLSAQVLAGIVDHGRYFELPTAIVRGFVTAAHRSGLIAVDAGWFDLALGAPHIDAARAKATLGWVPKHTAEDTLRELLHGIVEGAGAESIPLRARSLDEARLASLNGTATGGAESAGAPEVLGSLAAAPQIDWELLGLYLSDHLTGATAGAERIGRMCDTYVDTPVYTEISELAEELRLERAFLSHLIDDLNVRSRPYRQAAAWVGERVGRLKLNGRVFSRSPLSLVLEIELLRSAVVGKLGLWQTLAEHAIELGLDADVFIALGQRALEQAEMLSTAHEFARERAFRKNRTPFGVDDSTGAAENVE